jgi:hypothetical protein
MRSDRKVNLGPQAINKVLCIQGDCEKGTLSLLLIKKEFETRSSTVTSFARGD